jgi:predicted DCC family thiol-disulfide oxidoreductase YuxK
MSPHPLLYDPGCGFCRVCMALVLSWDRERTLRPVALTDPEAERLLAGMPEDERMASWHLVDPVDPSWMTNVAESATNVTHPGRRSGGAAFAPLFRLLPGGAPLARLADRFPDAARRAYRFVADRRSLFGKPLPAAVKRWADRVISESTAGGR